MVLDLILRKFGYVKKNNLTYEDLGVYYYIVYKKSWDKDKKIERGRTESVRFKKIPSNQEIYELFGKGAYEIYGRRSTNVYIKRVNIKRI